MPNFANIYLPRKKKTIHKQSRIKIFIRKITYLTPNENTQMLYSGYSCILWHTREDVFYILCQAIVTPIDVGTSIGPPNESATFFFSQPGSEASFHLQDITPISRTEDSLRFNREIERAKYATVPGQSVYERSIRSFNVCSVSLVARRVSNIVAVRLSVISHFARRSVHSKAITPYGAARTRARRRRKCYKYTKTFDTYTSRRLITQSTIGDGDLSYPLRASLGL